MMARPDVRRTLYHVFRKGMTHIMGCLFCQIADHRSPANIVYEDEESVAFEDIRPQAPVHVLIIPRRHISSLNQGSAGHELLFGRLLGLAARLAKEKGIDGSGYRLVINTNRDGGQTVFHIHIHLLGGRPLNWPPG